VRTRLPFAYLDGVSERAARATVAIGEAPVVYAVHIVAPLPLLSADIFNRDIADRSRTASAEE
jgi:hypothetical protein